MFIDEPLTRIAGTVSRIRVRWRLAPRRVRLRVLAAAAGIVLVFVTWYSTVYAPPAQFPTHHIITIDEGTTLSEVASRLEREHVVRSGTWFEALIQLTGGDGSIQAGDYYFKEPVGVLTVVSALISGAYGLEPVRVTIPEGSDVDDIGAILARNIPDFDMDGFVRIARPYEGYLFPDTYHFRPTATPEYIIEIMRTTFDRRFATLHEVFEASGRTQEDIVTMASILEREAIEYEDMRRVAGILWTRIGIGMPLQVDATFSYINDKTTFELTLEDLQDESPYNTYRYAGLPPGPIANPGVEALRAALEPEETPYLYYLSDRSSNLYYSETFEEHKRKKARYLD